MSRAPERRLSAVKVYTAGDLDGGQAVKEAGVYKMNPEQLRGTPDMSRLVYLEEDNVLDTLGYRYKKDQIYTSISQVLVAINPYQWLPVYDEDQAIKFTKIHETNEHVSSLPPHVFGVAEEAFSNLIKTGKNQSLIVCGESGSGKTESAKQLMRFLAYTTTRDKSALGTTHSHRRVGTDGQVTIEQQVLDANPILESFGNAKTNLNNNSSRFGKFTKILMDKVEGKASSMHIVGSYIETYLLEQSRIIGEVDKNERNYHIFYQICSTGLDPKLKSRFQLSGPEAFRYLNQSGCTTVNGINDVTDLHDHQHALLGLRVTPVDQESMYGVLAAILHIGNVEFDEDGDDCRISKKSEFAVQLAAEVLQVDYDALVKRLTTRTITVMRKAILKPLGKNDANDNRDSIAKTLYSTLFDWIVRKINDCLFNTNKEAQNHKLQWVGILDVFGFECFEHNSFEQFCINFANERLQEFFNTYIIASEQSLYRKEAILWDPISVPSNQDTIDLIDGRPQGIMALLDSACVMPKGTHEIFTQTLFTQHKSHKRLNQVKAIRYERDNKGGQKGKIHNINGFAVQHYAGTVIYNAAAFLVKNQGSTHGDTVELFMSAKSEVVRSLLEKEAVTNKSRSSSVGGRFVSTSSVFASQLRSLLDVLRATRPFFVRCIKPNLQQVPSVFDADYVRPQLRCGGLIEALRILKCGFPTRCPYDVVYERFKDKLKPLPQHVNTRDFTEGIFVLLAHPRGLTSKDYQMGLTMVFFRPGKQSYLEEILSSGATIAPEKLEKLRQFLVYKRMVRLRGVVAAQASVNRRLARIRAFARFKSAAHTVTIYTKTLRKFLRRVRFKKAAVTLQAAIRAHEAVGCRKNGMAYGVADVSKNPLYDAMREVHAWIRQVTGQALPGEFLSEIETGIVLCQFQSILDPKDSAKFNPAAAAGSFQARDNIMSFLASIRRAGVEAKDCFDAQDLVQHVQRGEKAVKNIITTMMNVAKVYYKPGEPCPEMVRKCIEKGKPLPVFQTTEELLAIRNRAMQAAIQKKKFEEEQRRLAEEEIKKKKMEEERRIKAEEERVRKLEELRKKEEEERIRREEEEKQRRIAEEARRKREEEEAKRRREEEERRRREEEERIRIAEEERRVREAEEKKRQREEAERLHKLEQERIRAEYEEKLRVEEEARKQREIERLKRLEEEKLRREEEERVRREEEAERARKEEEARKRREEEAKRRREEEDRLRQEEEERRREEEAERRRREEERRLKREVEEAKRHAEMERLREIAEEEERKRAEAAEDRRRDAAERKRKLQESKKFFTEGFTYMRQGDTDGAIECFDKAIDLNSKYATAFATRGLAHWMKGDFDATIADCNEAILLDPTYAQPYTTRGLAFREKGDRHKAIENYNKAIEYDPASVEAYNNRGLALREDGDFNGAIADCDKAISLMPQYAAAYNNRGIAYWGLENVDRAIEDFLKAIELNPHDAKACNSLGLAYWKREEVALAMKYYNKAIQIDPHYADAYANRGVAEQFTKNYESAIGSFEEAARCFTRRREMEQAKQAMETAAELQDLLASIE